MSGHFPEGVEVLELDELDPDESRGDWYLRQMLGSANIAESRAMDLMTGNLSHQIEHHLFPDLPSNRYPEIAPRVRALAAHYGLPYNTGSFGRQFGTTVATLARLSLPGPAPIGTQVAAPA